MRSDIQFNEISQEHQLNPLDTLYQKSIYAIAEDNSQTMKPFHSRDNSSQPPQENNYAKGGNQTLNFDYSKIY